MPFQIEFFNLQFQFAMKVAHILEISLTDALFEYTSIPVRIGVPFTDMVKTNSIWQKFVEYLGSNVTLERIFQYYLDVNGDITPIRPQYGCFSFDYLPSEKAVKIHFMNNDESGLSPLSDERQAVRKQEMIDMFTIIKRNYPETVEVLSSSWLYNVDSFRRLFPSQFFEHSTVKIDYRSLGMWGQFVNHYGISKQELADKFLTNLAKAQNLEDINNSFPYPDLKLYADIKYFYQFLAI